MGLWTKSLCGLAVAAAVAAGPVARAQDPYPEAVPGDVTAGMATTVDAMTSGLIAVGTPGVGGYDQSFAEALTAALMVDWEEPVVNFDYQMALVQVHLTLPLMTPTQNRAGVKQALRDGLVAYYLNHQVQAVDQVDQAAVSILMMNVAGALVATASSEDEEAALIIEEIILNHGQDHPLANTAIFDSFVEAPNNVGVLVSWTNDLQEELGGTATTCCAGTDPGAYIACVMLCYEFACAGRQKWWDRYICLANCALGCLVFSAPPY